MELNYVNSESSIKPLAVELAKHGVYLRKDISEFKKEDITYYSYKECFLTNEEFNAYQTELNVNSLNSLLNAQDNSDSNQLAMMEAIAELYSMIADLKEASNG